ncbi:retron Eco8 family effector endonuclease [Morganella morganii]|uniref:retron Eco8 family effector endonuclease n=2 Tax=Morganella morganii TaxID=582 RepID=UPI001BD56C13|nr:retron Eco8 family effector endonuclease [Morganella morganii]MBS9585434.1 retron Eco8 family effector endonuclease [Morganella morganii subsp. morganii]QWL87160.1 AAA family ATPase [Morganella morganii subsp. morganii]HDU8626019.1 retron Eco8 family effector endonuclease [Morganella morganii]
MGLQSIRIKNLLSFDDMIINSLEDINCIIGMNNTGKSNLMKMLKYFYDKLDDAKVIPPDFHSNYTPSGTITLTYDVTRIKKIVMNPNNNGRFHKHIYNTLFKPQSFIRASHRLGLPFIFSSAFQKKNTYSITLTISKDDSVTWSIKDPNARRLIKTLFPFFYIETRHIDLYDWNSIWKVVSSINSFNFSEIKKEELLEFLDEKISTKRGNYKKYIERVESAIHTKPYSYKDKVVNYLKIVLDGDIFTNKGEDLHIQSDGTNSHKYLEVILSLLISLTRTEFINPIIYIDEPEIGLHPKLSESFIESLSLIYKKYDKTSKEIEHDKYSTPYPRFLFSTHSSSLLKLTLKSFLDKQQILHFSKGSDGATKVSKLNSKYDDVRFINMISDNEARLFFSEYILFVEGATEVELFRNYNLQSLFPVLKRLDVYDCDEVMLKNINPNYSNAAIPFLVVKDIDQIAAVDFLNNKFKFNAKGRHIINKAINNERLSYFSRRKKPFLDVAKFLDSQDGRNVAFSNNGLKFKQFNIGRVVSSVNFLSSKDNIYYTSTTIEGSLINEFSLELFSKWVGNVIMNDLDIDNKNPSKMIKGLLQKYNIKTQCKQLFSKLFSNCRANHNLPSRDMRLLKAIKMRYMKEIINEFKEKIPDMKDQLAIIRLAFGGKTETLVSIEMHYKIEEKPICQDILNYIKELKTDNFYFLYPYMGKTSGWVTSFIDFSLNYYAGLDKEKVRKNFRLAFPELSHIIDHASSSIEAGGLK